MLTTTTPTTETETMNALIATQAAWLTARRAYAVTSRRHANELDQLRAARDAAERAFRQVERETVAALGPAASLRLAADAFSKARELVNAHAVTRQDAPGALSYLHVRKES